MHIICHLSVLRIAIAKLRTQSNCNAGYIGNSEFRCKILKISDNFCIDFNKNQELQRKSHEANLHNHFFSEGLKNGQALSRSQCTKNHSHVFKSRFCLPQKIKLTVVKPIFLLSDFSHSSCVSVCLSVCLDTQHLYPTFFEVLVHKKPTFINFSLMLYK